METVSFKPVKEFKAVADQLFIEQRALILQHLPFAEVEHIGSTAIPGSITKGDLDVNVRVKKEDFAGAVQALKQMYKVNQPNNWTGNFASFKDDKNLALDFGVQLTVIGSPDDVYLANRDFLLKHPDAVKKLNEIKMQYNGKSMDVYREAKDHFFQELFL